MPIYDRLARTLHALAHTDASPGLVPNVDASADGLGILLEHMEGELVQLLREVGNHGPVFSFSTGEALSILLFYHL